MDLSYNIVAKTIQAGWDKAKSLIGDLSKAFDGFAGRSAVHWAKFGAGAATAFALVVNGARKMRDGVLREIDKMEERDLSFRNVSDRFNRKTLNVSTVDEKNKLVEGLDREIGALTNQKNKLARKEGSQDFLEKQGDKLQRAMNWSLGLGYQTDAERDLQQIGDNLKQLEAKKKHLLTLNPESRYDRYVKERDAADEEINRKQDAANTLEMSGPIIAQEKAQKALNEAKIEQARLEEVLRTSANGNDEQAETNLKRQIELVGKLNSTLEEAAEAAKNYDPPETTAREPYVNPWGGEMGGGKGEREDTRKTGTSKKRDKRGRLIEIAPADYGPAMKKGLTESNVGLLAEGHGSQGFGSRGGHVTGFHTPAFLERAIGMRQGRSGQEDQQDPRLIEMKKQTEHLANIEKKTGAAP